MKFYSSLKTQSRHDDHVIYDNLSSKKDDLDDVKADEDMDEDGNDDKPQGQPRQDDTSFLSPGN